MFDLEKGERFVIAFLVAALILGIGISWYGKTRPGTTITVGTFSGEKIETARRIAPVNINTASIPELTRIPGIGPHLAAAIVADRASSGPFLRVEDLDRVKGVGPRLIGKIRALIVVE